MAKDNKAQVKEKTVRGQGEEAGIRDVSPQILESLDGVQGQLAFMRQQFAQLAEINSKQANYTIQTNQAVLQELQKFQTAAPQRAMAAVFHKLFRDLLAVINDMDHLIRLAESEKSSDESSGWLESISILRASMERTLIDWGCTPITIKLGEEEFDPEYHEAVQAQEGDVPAHSPLNVIVKVKRRGWRLNDTIIQYPLVVVS